MNLIKVVEGLPACFQAFVPYKVHPTCAEIWSLVTEIKFITLHNMQIHVHCIFKMSQKSDISGIIRFSCKAINLLFSLAQWANARGCCKKNHTHTKIYPEQAKFKSYIWTCPKGKLEFKFLFSVLIHKFSCIWPQTCKYWDNCHISWAWMPFSFCFVKEKKRLLMTLELQLQLEEIYSWKFIHVL